MSLLFKINKNIVNLTGLALFVTYTVHTFRVYTAWETKKIDFKQMETEVAEIKVKLSDDEWYKMVEEKVKSSKEDGILQRELLASFSKTSPPIKDLLVPVQVVDTKSGGSGDIRM